MTQNLKIVTGIISLGLLVTLIYRLIFVPGGMILSGLFLGGMWIILVLVVGLLLTWLTKLVLKKLPFWTAYFTLTMIAFVYFHYQIYSPTIKIIVPENYVGQVSLIKSNVTDNLLNLDSNGIGYLNDWTFRKLYSKPIVVDSKGKDLMKQCVGFNPSTFFGFGTLSSSENQIDMEVKSFEIVPTNKVGQKQYYHTDLRKLVDYEKIK